MNKALAKMNEINFNLENLYGKKSQKKIELIEKDKYGEEINSKIVELNAEIINLTNQKKLYEQKEQILYETKDNAKLNVGIISILLMVIPAAIMGFSTFDYQAVIISLLFSSVTVIPISGLVYYRKYSNLKKQLNVIDYQAILRELKVKEQESSLENQKYDVYEKQMLEITNIIDEIDIKIDELLKQKSKVQKIIDDEINKTINISQKNNDNNIKQKKMIFRKNKKDV